MRLGAFGIMWSSDPNLVVEPNDTPGYEAMAHALFGANLWEAPDEASYSVRTPGYPVLVASVYAAIGPRRWGVVLVQILLGVGTIALTMWTASRLAPRKAGTIAGVLVAFDVPTILYGNLILTETLFTALLMIAIAAGVQAVKGHRLAWAVVVGAAIAGATYVRPIGYFLIWPVAAVLLLSYPATTGMLTRVRFGATTVVTFFVLVLPWHVRNLDLTGSRAFSTISTVNLYHYRAAQVLALRDGVSLEEVQERLRDDDLVAPGGGEVALSEMRKRAIDVFVQHPLLLVRVQVRGMARMAIGPAWETGRKLLGDGLHPLVMVISFGVTLVIYFGFISQILFGGIRSARWPDWLILVTVGYFFLLSGGPEASSRLRVPVVPLMAIFSGMGITSVLAKFRSDRAP
jgi:4-amino-4-deoxy-L-arabinose transferase-like glycosyltransferase